MIRCNHRQTTTTPRNLYPWENAILASAAAAVFALGIAVFIERPLRELWRWLLVGSLIPIFLFLVANNRADCHLGNREYRPARTSAVTAW